MAVAHVLLAPRLASGGPRAAARAGGAVLAKRARARECLLVGAAEHLELRLQVGDDRLELRDAHAPPGGRGAD